MLIATIRLGVVIVSSVNDRLLCEERMLFPLSLRLLFSARRESPVKISFLGGVVGPVVDLLIAGLYVVLLVADKQASLTQLKTLAFGSSGKL